MVINSFLLMYHKEQLGDAGLNIFKYFEIGTPGNLFYFGRLGCLWCSCAAFTSEAEFINCRVA